MTETRQRGFWGGGNWEASLEHVVVERCVRLVGTPAYHRYSPVRDALSYNLVRACVMLLPLLTTSLLQVPKISATVWLSAMISLTFGLFIMASSKP